MSCDCVLLNDWYLTLTKIPVANVDSFCIKPLSHSDVKEFSGIMWKHRFFFFQSESLFLFFWLIAFANRVKVKIFGKGDFFLTISSHTCPIFTQHPGQYLISFPDSFPFCLNFVHFFFSFSVILCVFSPYLKPECLILIWVSPYFSLGKLI